VSIWWTWAWILCLVAWFILLSAQMLCCSFNWVDVFSSYLGDPWISLQTHLGFCILILHSLNVSFNILMPLYEVYMNIKWPSLWENSLHTFSFHDNTEFAWFFAYFSDDELRKFFSYSLVCLFAQSCMSAIKYGVFFFYHV
jgi:hypothetical protein